MYSFLQDVFMLCLDVKDISDKLNFFLRGFDSIKFIMFFEMIVHFVIFLSFKILMVLSLNFILLHGLGNVVQKYGQP